MILEDGFKGCGQAGIVTFLFFRTKLKALVARVALVAGLLGSCFSLTFAHPPAQLADTIDMVRPSLVGVGEFYPAGSPRSLLTGTGFAVMDGSRILTNYHVIAPTLEAQQGKTKRPARLSELNQENAERYVAVFIQAGGVAEVIRADIEKLDEDADLALLKLPGRKLAPLKLSNQVVREGDYILFTGLPVASALGFHPITHRGIISGITPVATPAYRASQLNPGLLKRLRNSYNVYQLDATAYPGNSGSPVYQPGSAKVIAVVNKTLVQKSKEAALTNPSGISYAIPANRIRLFLEAN